VGLGIGFGGGGTRAEGSGMRDGRVCVGFWVRCWVSGVGILSGSMLIVESR